MFGEIIQKDSPKKDLNYGKSPFIDVVPRIHLEPQKRESMPIKVDYLVKPDDLAQISERDDFPS